MKATEHTTREACICIGFRRIAQKITAAYDNALRPAGISVNQFSLLINISRMEGCGTGQLAKKIKLEKSTLVRTLQPLLRGGLIVDKSPLEKRGRELYLTPAGKKVLQKALPLWVKVQETAKTKLGKSHDEIVELLRRVNTWE